MGRVGLGVGAEEGRGRNGEQNHVSADTCLEMQVEFGGGEQVIQKMRLMHRDTGTRVRESKVKANMGKERLVRWEGRKLLVQTEHGRGNMRSVKAAGEKGTEFQ